MNYLTVTFFNYEDEFAIQITQLDGLQVDFFDTLPIGEIIKKFIPEVK